jgi:hypothetical protein
VTSVIVCQAMSYPMRRVMDCPFCKTRRRMLARDELWYGTSLTCCHCGHTWQDGERRPATKDQCAYAAAEARRKWIEAGVYDSEDHRAWTEEQTGS